MNERLQSIPVSERLNQTVNHSLTMIYKEEKRRKVKKRVLGLGSMAAVFVFTIIFCMANPALASDIPLIGNIFERMQDEVTFRGDYHQVGEVLEPVYTEHSDKLTVTLSEVYCNSDALYISMQLKSNDAFDDIHDFECVLTASSDFCPDDVTIAEVLEGDFIDKNTYEGILRLGLEYWITDTSFSENNSSHWNLSINEITAPSKNTEDTVSFSGPWDFEFDVSIDNKMTKTVMINEWNEQGVGLEKVVKDRFEITIYDVYKGNNMKAEYIPIVLDAEGKAMLDDGAGNTIAIGTHDISTINVFLMDWDKWMDIKGDYWNQPDGYWNSENALTEEGRTLKQFLLDECTYHKEVVF